MTGVTFTIGADGKATTVVVEELNLQGEGTFKRLSVVDAHRARCIRRRSGAETADGMKLLIGLRSTACRMASIAAQRTFEVEENIWVRWGAFERGNRLRGGRPAITFRNLKTHFMGIIVGLGQFADCNNRTLKGRFTKPVRVPDLEVVLKSANKDDHLISMAVTGATRFIRASKIPRFWRGLGFVCLPGSPQRRDMEGGSSGCDNHLDLCLG